MGNPARPSSTYHGDDLVSQPNPAHFLASQKNSNPTRPTTGWRVKRVGSWVHLIKKILFFHFFQSKLNCNFN